jgi:thymidylate kinase
VTAAHGHAARGEAGLRPSRIRVALIGADGSGKSTISRMLETASLPAPVKRIYMGVNLEASSLMLPTTRLLVAAKRAQGGSPDLMGTAPDGSAHTGGPHTWRRSARSTARMLVWFLEEWLRQAVAWWYSRAGYLVVFDRHFLADYYDSDIAHRPARRGAVSAFHGWMLLHAYPKPDLVICLDAPGSVLFARKPESSPEWLEQRRQQYLRLADVLPAFVVVDADRPLDEVLTEVVDTIRDFWKATTA